MTSNKSSDLPTYSCCITQCKNYGVNTQIGLYPLPDDVLQREKCCEILGIPLEVGLSPTARVCGLHFKSKVGTYRPPAPSVQPGLLPKPLTLMTDDGRRLSFRPILPRAQTVFPTPVQQPFTFQQPLTFTFNAVPSTNVQQNASPKGPINDSTDEVENVDDNKEKKDSNPCDSSDITLQLECEEDFLSSTQLNAYMKDLVDFCNASDLVRRLPPPEPRVPSIFQLSSNSESLEMPPLEKLSSLTTSLFPNTSFINSPTTASSSIQNSQFVNIVSPTNKGVSVVSNPFLKSALINSTNVETISSSVTRPLFVNSPVLTPRNKATTLNDKNPAFITLNGTQMTNSFGANLSSNGLALPWDLVPTVASSNAAVNISTNPVSVSSVRSQTITSPAFPFATKTSQLPNATPLATSLPGALLKNSSGGQSNQVLQLFPEILFKYKIVNAGSKNSAIPIMLMKAFDTSDVGQSSKTPETSASSSPLTIVGRELDETESCAASLCDVTFSEASEQIFFHPEQNAYSNDQPTVFNQANENSSDKISIEDLIQESGLSVEETQSSNNINDKIGPVIVDVISAKEGATEFFNANTIPNILLDKSKNSEDSNDSATNSQMDTSAKSSVDKVVYCTHDKMFSMSNDSIFSIQKFIPVIANGKQILSEIIHMFRIKTPMSPRRSEEADTLRARLRQENFIPWAVWWLIQRRYMPVVHPCTFCGSKRFIVDKNDNYPDGFCWTCANSTCPVQKPISRPAFFERFKLYSIPDLLLLTYHWASQSSFEEITQDVDLDCEKIWCYFKALQELCHQVAIKKGKLGLVQSSMVEVSAIKVGKVFILGALDRKTRYVRLEAITEVEAYQSPRHITLLEKWMNRSSTIITENRLPKDCLPGVRKLCVDPTIVDRFSGFPHIMNISKYLSKTMTAMFGEINQHSLKTTDIQGFLYELQWREKYGKFVDMSFWSILNHIRDLNVEEGSPVQVRKGAFSTDHCGMDPRSTLNSRWGPLNEDLDGKEEFVVLLLQDKANKDTDKSLSLPREPTLKLSGKDVKSYSKDSKSYSKDSKSYSKDTNIRFGDYFHDIPEIKSGSAMVTSKSLLAVKIRFGESPADIDFYKSDAICLGLKLKSEGFTTKPVKWLVKKGFVKPVSTCYVCQGVALLKQSSRFSDGCSWACQNEKCKFENVFRRPSFFARYPYYPMSHVAGMIFHWIVQSDESLINTDVPMDASKIVDVWRSFQGLCSSSIKRKKPKIGGEKYVVEVGVVKFGRLFILGALDRKTKITLLQAFPSEVGKIDNICSTLQSWILPESTIVIDAVSKNFKMLVSQLRGYNITLADRVVIDRYHPSCHILNVKHYLLKHLHNMFCHIKSNFMRLEIMQSYLEELMWREQYGKEPQQAFAYIMNEIFYNDLREKFDYSKERKDPEFIPVKFKELRVLLRKIPKSVLKFYGCENVPDTTNTSFSEHTEKRPSSPVLDILNDTLSIPNTMQSPDTMQCSDTMQYSDTMQCPDAMQRLSESDDEVMIIDPDVPSRDIPVNTETVVVQSDIVEPPDTSESTSSSNTSEIFTNKVQPLVIKMHKKEKKFKSYLKSDLEKFKKLELDNSLSNGVSNNVAVRTDLNLAKSSTIEFPDISSDSSYSNAWETQSTDSTKSNNKPSRKRAAACSNKDERPICIECGEHVGFPYDHFIKQFKCTDCKTNSVYTTCCSKAFFEHRGSILFGKRMPRRKKEDYGLHRPMTLRFPWHCACGFSTKNGNSLASHMVNCRKRTCYYHQNIL